MAAQHSTTTDFSSRYKFNGKELDQETGCYYGVYPEIFGRARYYNPSISRWLSVDPLAEKYTSFSPYNFTLDNPVRLVDFDGRSVDWYPKVNDNGSVSYVAEKGDSAETLSKQYNIPLDKAKELIGDQEIVANKTSISGEAVNQMFGSEILKLDLKSKMANEQRIFDQFLFARAHSTTLGQDYFTPKNYFKSIRPRSNFYTGEAVIKGSNVMVSYSFPIRRIAFSGHKYFNIYNEPWESWSGGSTRFKNPIVGYKLPLLYPEKNTRTGMHAIIYTENYYKNVNLLESIIYKKYPVYHYVQIKRFKN